MGDAEEQDMGVPPSGSGHQPTASAAVPASSQSDVPNAVNAAYNRLHKFAVEWKVMERRSSYDGNIYELHPGDARHAVCRIDDVIALLEAVNERTPPKPGRPGRRSRCALTLFPEHSQG